MHRSFWEGLGVGVTMSIGIALLVMLCRCNLAAGAPQPFGCGGDVRNCSVADAGVSE